MRVPMSAFFVDRNALFARMYLYIGISAGSACLTTQSCATTSRATRLSAKTAGDDVVGSAGDRCVAGGEGCPMAGSRLSRVCDFTLK